MLRFSLLTVFLCFWSFFANATEVEVKVFEKGTNAVEARSKALKSAEKRGFTAIIKKKAPDRALEILKDYEGYNIERYVLGYRAEKEVVTNTSYRATIIMDFDDTFIDSVTMQSGSTTNQFGAKPVNTKAILVIPILRGTKDTALWDERNIWRDYVNRAVLEIGRGRYVVAYGDSSDKLTVNSDTIMNANYNRLRPLLQRYGADRVLIATLYDTGLDDLTLTLREITSKRDDFETKRIPISKEISRPENVNKVARQMLVDHRDKAIIDLDPEQAAETMIHQINAFMPYGGPQSWNDLRKRMEFVPMVEAMQVIGAGRDGLKVSITFKGRPEKFGAALKSQNIEALQQDETLVIRLR